MLARTGEVRLQCKETSEVLAKTLLHTFKWMLVATES